MAKVIRISDTGLTGSWATFPGNKGDIANDLGTIDDTIFGQNFKSMQPGLLGATLSFDGMIKGFAGYVATLYKNGATTGMVAEPMSLISGKTYKTTNAAKNMWNRAVTFTVFDNAVDQTANVLSINFAAGTVTFKAAYTVTGPVTVTGSYFPKVRIARGKGFTLTQTTNVLDDTDFETAQGNSGTKTFEAGLKTVSLSVNGIYADASANLATLLARSEIMIEVNPDGALKDYARGIFKMTQQGSSANVGDLELETLNFTLFVPDSPVLFETPFSWVHDSTSTLNASIRKALDSWEQGTVKYYAYVPAGAAGVQAPGIISDISLTGGLEVMNDFTLKTQLVGQIVVYVP